MRIRAIIAAFVVLLAASAQARTVEPGSFTVAGGIGPAFRLPSPLAAGRTYLVLQAQGEYDFTSSLGALADLSFGFGSSQPLRLHLGARYRVTQLDLPVSPYAQAQLALGRLYNVLGADLTYIGARLGVGADYFLTKKLGAGALVAMDLGGTTASRRAFYGTVDVLVYAAYTF